MLKNSRGFTLVEMLIVMLIITVLMLLIIPNILSQSDNINKDGCKALVAVVQAQSDAYYLEEGSNTSIDNLATEGYISDSQKECNNVNLEINAGVVSLSNSENED